MASPRWNSSLEGDAARHAGQWRPRGVSRRLMASGSRMGSDLGLELREASAVDPVDHEVARARAAVMERLLGTTPEPVRFGRFVPIERVGAGAMGTVYAAFDPQLDRKVALKLLTPRGDPAAQRERLMREAQVMARLAHPNVAHVYEVGEHEGRLFVAMEYVRGVDLRRWCASPARSVAEVLAVCMQAGRGLAAAHGEGIVHRDFKPDNVLVGDDGRVRVLDFGLARPFEVALPTESEVDAPSAVATASGTTAAGTPAYAAPELWRGEPATPESDQFAFCVTVWEALTGALPFTGSDIARLRAAILAGHVGARPDTMPPWIDRRLRRGLAPQGRYPSMNALLRELDLDPARRRRAGMAAAVVCAGLGIAYVLGRGAAPDPSGDTRCSGGTEALAASWSDDERQAALAHISSLGELGADTADQLGPTLDGYATAWTDGHRDACRAHLRGEHSAEILDRRMICLARGSGAFAALGQLAATVDAQGLDGLAQAAAQLPDPQECGDLERLGRLRDPTPVGATDLAARIADLRLRVSSGNGHLEPSSVDALVERARAFGHHGLLAEALYLRGRVLIDIDQIGDAVVPLREATEAALAAGDDELATLAWSNAVFAVANGPSHDDPWIAAQPLLLALIERISPSSSAVGALNNLCVAATARDRPDEAERLARRAVEIGRAVDDPAPLSLARALDTLAMHTVDPVERVAFARESAALFERALGPHHHWTLRAELGALALGEVGPASLDAFEARTLEMERLHPTLDHLHARNEGELAYQCAYAGDRERGRAALRRLLALEGTRSLDDVARALDAWWRGDAGEAARLAEATLDERDRSPDPRFFARERTAEFAMILGASWAALGDPRARAMLLRARDEFTQALAAGQGIPIIERRLALAERELAALDVTRTKAEAP